MDKKKVNDLFSIELKQIPLKEWNFKQFIILQTNQFSKKVYHISFKYQYVPM